MLAWRSVFTEETNSGSYTQVGDMVRYWGSNDPPLLVPTGKDGLRGVQFVHAAVESSRRDAAWVQM